MSIQPVQPPSVTTAAVGYSPAILADCGRLLFISGQGPRDLQADPETQIRQTFEAIQAVVEEAGGSLQNVVMLRAYFLNMARDLAAFRKVRLEYLAEPFPASTAVGVTELAVEGLQVEIEAVAVL